MISKVFLKKSNNNSNNKGIHKIKNMWIDLALDFESIFARLCQQKRRRKIAKVNMIFDSFLNT